MNKTFTVSQNIAQEAINVHEQKTSFSDTIRIDSSAFMDPRNQCHAITRGRGISYIRSEIPSAENKTGILPSCNGATT